MITKTIAKSYNGFEQIRHASIIFLRMTTTNNSIVALKRFITIINHLSNITGIHMPHYKLITIQLIRYNTDTIR